MAIAPILVVQSSTSDVAPHWAVNSTLNPDFTIGATSPTVTPADGTTSASSVIIINPVSGFIGTVTLSDSPLPANIACTPIVPASIPNALGTATLSCTSIVAGIYAVTIVGTSGEISHNTTRAFTFAAFASPDFTITAPSVVSLSSSRSVTTSVTLTSLGGFHSRVNLTSTIYPNFGLSVSLNPQYLDSGAGLATATFNSSSPGDYTVAIIGSSKSLSHMINIVVTVTLTNAPDFTISTSSSTIRIEAGNPGTVRIVITPDNGFASTVSLVVTAPLGVSCWFSSTTIEPPGTSTLTCTGNTPGDYPIMITATVAGAGSHTTTVNVYVAPPVAPVSSMLLGTAPTAFYAIIAVIVVGIVTGTILVLSKKRSSAKLL